MKTSLIKYELAKLLRDKGFNEECFGCYDLKTGYVYSTKWHPEQDNRYLLAPTHHQLIDWFDRQGIFIQPHLIEQLNLDAGWGYELVFPLSKDKTKLSDISDDDLGLTDEDESFATRHEALNDAFYKALKLL